jgi:hypothetical protein
MNADPNDPIDAAPCAARQTSALLWLLFHCAAGEPDAGTWRAALSHLRMVAANPGADPMLRVTCERLAASALPQRPAERRDLH